MSNCIFEMNDRKKYYTFFNGSLLLMIFSLVSLLFLNSCVESKRSKIYPLVKNIKENCNDSTSIMSMEDIELEEDTVILSFTLKDDDIIQCFDTQQTNHTKEFLLMLLCANQNEKGWKELLDAIKENDIYIKVCFNLQELKRNFSVFLSPLEIKDGFTKYRDFSPYRLRIMAGIIMSKTQLPIKIDEVTTFVDYKLDNSKVYYIYKVEESESIDMLNANKDEIKKMLLAFIQEQVKDEKKHLKSFLENCSYCKIPIVYRYIGTKTNNILEIVIECHEYEPMLKPFYEQY